jgi:hypothetical protein
MSAASPAVPGLARPGLFHPGDPVESSSAPSQVFITEVISVPYPAIGGSAPDRVILETSPGPPLSVVSVPRPGIGGSAQVSTVYDISVVSVPFPALAISVPVPLNFNLRRTGPRPLRTWQRDIQRFAIDQEREHHVQALWQYGELAVFALAWSTIDLTAGLAVRCPRCFTNAQATSLALQPSEAAIAAAYGQGNQYSCPLCYNTQMVSAKTPAPLYPGLRALLVRPAVFTDLDQDRQKTAKGVMNTGTISAESTPDFRVRSGDWMFRVTGERFRLRVPRRVTLRTGFASPYQEAAAITYNLMNANLEDPTTVAYIIPPDASALHQWLGTYTRVPVSYSGLEVINGPLIPVEITPPAAAGKLQPNAVFPFPVS